MALQGASKGRKTHVATAAAALGIAPRLSSVCTRAAAVKVGREKEEEGGTITRWKHDKIRLIGQPLIKPGMRFSFKRARVFSFFISTNHHHGPEKNEDSKSAGGQRIKQCVVDRRK